MPKSKTYSPHTLTALVLAVLNAANPTGSFAFLENPQALWNTKSIRMEITSQALAAEPAGGRYPAILQVSARVRSFKEARTFLEPSAPPETVLEAYNAEHALRAKAIQTRVDQGEELTIPPESTTRLVYHADEPPKKFGNFGVLSLTKNEKDIQKRLILTQKNYHKLLLLVMLEKVAKLPPGPASERIKKELLATPECLVKLDPESFHLTMAGIQRGSQFQPASPRYWNLRRNIKNRTREIAQFGREIILKFNGRLTIITEGTPAIAVLLSPETEEDLFHLQKLKTAYGARLTYKRALAHISLFYIRGRWDPDKKDWIVTPRQLACLVEATQRLEKELKPFEEAPIPWKVNQLAVVSSDRIDAAGQEEGAPVQLMSEEDHVPARIQGEETLLNAWKHSGKTDADPLPWNDIDATLGLFPKFHLPDRNSLLAAIGKGAVSAKRVIYLVRKAKKLKVKELLNAKTGDANFRLTTEYDRPGLLLAISRVIDQYGGNVTKIEFDSTRHDDDPRARTAINLSMTHIGKEEAEALGKKLAAIPDIGHRILWSEFLYNAGTHVVDPFIGMRTIHLDFQLDARQHSAGMETRRSMMLQALMDLDPRCLVSGFSVDRGEIVDMRMTVHVPRSVANRVKGELRRAAGLVVDTPSVTPLQVSRSA
jgi:hypothetical protein